MRFHDGHELTSDDVVYTFNSILDPAFELADPGRISDRRFRRRPRPAHGRIRLNAAVRIVFDQPRRPRLCRPAPDASCAIIPSARARISSSAIRRRRPASSSAPSAIIFDGLPRNLGIVLKIVPDDIMRGLELRKAHVDLVVNDIPPDMAYQLEKEGLALTTSPGVELPVPRVQLARSDPEGCSSPSRDGPRDRSAGASSIICAADSRRRRSTSSAAHQLGHRTRRLRCSTTILSAPDSSSTKPAIPIPTATARGPRMLCR